MMSETKLKPEAVLDAVRLPLYFRGESICLGARFCSSSLAWPLAAQNASITGTVSDPQHAPIPDAAVTLTNVDMGIAIRANTDLEGNYEFVFVRPGNYIIGNDVQVATDAEVALGAGARVPLAARRLLGHRRRRRDRARGQALARPRRRRRDRPHGDQARRAQMSVRPPWLRRGVRGPRGDGGARPREARRGPQDRPLQADGAARPHAPHERHLGERAGARATSSRPS